MPESTNQVQRGSLTRGPAAPARRSRTGLAARPRANRYPVGATTRSQRSRFPSVTPRNPGKVSTPLWTCARGTLGELLGPYCTTPMWIVQLSAAVALAKQLRPPASHLVPFLPPPAAFQACSQPRRTSARHSTPARPTDRIAPGGDGSAPSPLPGATAHAAPPSTPCYGSTPSRPHQTLPASVIVRASSGPAEPHSGAGTACCPACSKPNRRAGRS